MTDQRNRLTTDPGLGPIVEHASTLRSIAAAAPVPDDESPGAPVYYEPSPLNAVCEHKTLELETVKLAEDIDPRKLPTELSLRRPVLHLMPASDPNWPAPPAQYDSGWPPPETVLTTSQPPQAARRRSFIPLVLLVLLGASLLLVFGSNARRRSAASVIPAHPAQAALAPVAAAATPVEALPSAEPAASSESAVPPDSAASASAGEPTASAGSARAADAPHHSPFKPIPPSIANSPALSAPPTAKPKRAIY